MAVEVGFWNVNNKKVKKINYQAIESEEKLEKILENEISILSEDLLLIGRQIPTGFGKFIDMLAIDSEGNIVIIELKKKRTSRDVVAQIIDYASWIERLSNEEIKNLYKNNNNKQLEEDFDEKFKDSLPEILNVSHKMIIISAELDDSTERIVQYLSSNFNVPINAMFFRYFKDGDNEYISRSWLIDPHELEENSAKIIKKDSWNRRDFVVNFGDGDNRSWEDAREYGFISAGNGNWYTKTLNSLNVGSRIFCMIPKLGYVGIGIVTSKVVPLSEAVVEVNGTEKKLVDCDLRESNFKHDINDLDLCEYVVSINWEKTVEKEKAYWIKGLVSNQNSAFKLRSQFTIDKVEQFFKSIK